MPPLHQKVSPYLRRQFFKKNGSKKTYSTKERAPSWPLDWLYQKNFISEALFKAAKRYYQANRYATLPYPSLAAIKNPLLPRGTFNESCFAESETQKKLYTKWRIATSFLSAAHTKPMVDKILLEGDMEILKKILHSRKCRILLKESFEALGRIFEEGGSL